jgi:hypothetical protein
MDIKKFDDLQPSLADEGTLIWQGPVHTGDLWVQIWEIRETRVLFTIDRDGNYEMFDNSNNGSIVDRDMKTLRTFR